MRSPNPKTLSTAIAKAEAFRPCAGTALHLTPAEARALIHETTATQAAVHRDGNVPSRWTPAADAWDACGYRDVLGIRGRWIERRLAPAGYVARFVVSVIRGASTYEVDIITSALQAPKAEG